MRPPFRSLSHAWLVIPLCACVFLAWTDYERARRVESVTRTDAEDAIVDATSPTGYAGGKRWLIVPERNNRSYQWIAETQHMLARGEWRVRHVDYDNAPYGREVHSASPYRWWLGLVAWCDHAVSGRPLGLSVERAAVWADPILHLLLVLGATLFAARSFGPFPAALLAVGLVTLFPLAGSFLPGAPDDHGLAWACGFWSVLFLVAGAAGSHFPSTNPAGQNRRARRCYVLAGFAGGVSLWINAVQQTAVLTGLAVGGVLAAWITSRARAGKPGPAGADETSPWRIWALSGAITSLAAYLVEYYPAHLETRLEANHPLYALAWLGLGELLTQTERWFAQRKFACTRGQAAWLVVAIASLAALPIALWLAKTRPLLTLDPLAARLSGLPDGAVAKNFAVWIVRDGLTGAVAATGLPLLLVGTGLWQLVRRGTGADARAALAIAAGPVLLTLVIACSQLRWWNLFDGMLLALLMASLAGSRPSRGTHLRVGGGGWRGAPGSASLRPALLPEKSPTTGRWAPSRGTWAGLAAVVFLPGLLPLWPLPAGDKQIAFTPLEARGLIERALAHWIADRAEPGRAVVLGPPDKTTSWSFHGGLRGIGSANRENRDGLAATVAIITAGNADEAQALLNQRGITHLVLPSWDTDLDEFARWSLKNPNDGFLMAVHNWALPPWLRPLPYRLPVVPGLEGQSVAVFQVTDDSNRAAASSRLAEYFLESDRLELAVAMIPGLQRYPTDLGALVALAQVEKARGDAERFDKTLATLLSSLAGGFDRALAWDRRVSLAVVLAQGGHPAQAREQTRRCLEALDEARLRAMTTASLFRLQVLGKSFDLPIADPQLRALAVRLLPAELRGRVEGK